MKQLMSVILVAVIILVFAVIYVSANTDSHEWEQVTVTVESGDSLWKLSSKYCPDDMDMQEYIHLIREENNLKSSTIYAGWNITMLKEAN